MSLYVRGFKRVGALLGFALLSACAGTGGGGQSGFRAADETNGLVHLAGDEFGSSAQARALYATAWAREEYVLYKSPHFHGEFVHISTRDDGSRTLYINRYFDLDGPLDSFRHSQSATRKSGEAFRLSVDDVQYWAKPFLLPESGESCAVFSGSWGITRKYHRPSNALFGVFCGPGNNEMAPEAIKKMVSRLTIDKTKQRTGAAPVSTSVPAIDPTADQAALAALVRGVAGSDTGNVNFPYKVVRPKMVALPGGG